MALNHGQLMGQPKFVANDAECQEGRNGFVYELLHAIERPKTTITNVRSRNLTTNVFRQLGQPTAFSSSTSSLITTVVGATLCSDIFSPMREELG